MNRFVVLVLGVLVCLHANAQDTVFVFGNYEKLSSAAPSEYASYYTISTTPDKPFQGEVPFYHKDTHQLHAQVGFDAEGKRDGVTTYFYKEGGTQSQHTFSRGEANGPYKRWYQNGQLQTEGLATPITIQQQTNASGSTAYPSTDYLLLQYWDSLGNQLVVDGKGEYSSYHPQGALKEKGTYQEGRKVGHWEGYRADGSLYFQEEYRGGILSEGTSWAQGKKYTYTQLEEEAQPLEGMMGFYQFLGKNVKYPKKAVKARVQGTVYVRFVIDESGKVIHAESVEGRELGYGLDQEAIRVIRLTKWTPGRQKGIPVKERKILPVKFKVSR